MNICILEDDPQRVTLLQQKLEGHDLTVLNSCAQIDSKFKPPYDLYLLDHDLGGRQMEAHEDCGLTFVRLVGDRTGDSPVIIHSYNQDGAKAMALHLKELVIPMKEIWVLPFGSAKFFSVIDHHIKGAQW